MESNSLKNGIFSFIIPGLGQILNGDAQKGAALLAGAVILHLFIWSLLAGAVILHLFIWFFMNNPLGSLINTAYHAYAGYDAYKNY